MAEASLAERVRAGDRRALAQAITLVESTLPEQQREADALLAELLPFSGGAHRVAITGPPGAGKSTLVDALGAAALDAGKRVAVLAVDPASAISGGALLGDAIRMRRLAASERAFLRPSSNSGSLGGTAPGTRDAILLCEAAGFDLVLVETVGVGQAEQAARDVCDTLVLLTLLGTGDEIQGMKRGLLEVADAVLVSKADGELEAASAAHARSLEAALGLLRPAAPPHIAAISALTGAGVGELLTWLADRHARTSQQDGGLQQLRSEQLGRAFDTSLSLALMAVAAASPALPALRAEVLAGRVPPRVAVKQLLQTLLGR